jgi:DNA-directed RNA polymerase subunit omega
MILPTSDRLEGKTDSIYALCVLAAKRARQIKDPMVRQLAEVDSNHPLTVALEEIADGLIKAREVELVVVEEPEDQPEVWAASTGIEEPPPPSVHELLGVGVDDEESEEVDESDEGENVKDLFEAIASGDVEPIVVEEEDEEEDEEKPEGFSTDDEDEEEDEESKEVSDEVEIIDESADDEEEA